MRIFAGNIVRFSSLCLLGAAATVAGSAHGQQMVFDPTPEEVFTVSALTVDQCSLADRGFEAGVPENVVMVNQLPAACGSVLGQHMRDEADANPARIQPMYRADASPWPENLASTTPDNLRDGLLDAFVESGVKLTDNSGLSYGASMLSTATPVGGSLIVTRDPAAAASFNAHPDWTARGQQLGGENPCGEWVWKGYYDYSRFEDAATACGTDDECVYQVAFALGSPSGIAFRTDKLTGQGDGTFAPDELPPIPLMSGFRMKNPFFGVAPEFLLDQQAGLLEDLQRFQLESGVTKATNRYVELQAGPKDYACAGGFRFRNPASKYYMDPNELGASSHFSALDMKYAAIRSLLQKKAGYLLDPTPVQSYLFPQAEKFTSEWHFHKAMHDRQRPHGGEVGQPLTKAERAAIDERTQTLLDLIEKYTLLTSAIAYGQGVPAVGSRLRNPVDELVSQIVNPVDAHGGGELINPVARRRDAMVRNAVVSTMRRDLVPRAKLSLLPSTEATVTSQMAVPMRAMSLPSQPTSPYTKSRLTDATTPTAGKLVGTAVDYGKTTEVETASVRDASAPSASFGGYLGSSTASCPSPVPETEAFVDIYELARAAQEVQEQIVALLLDEYARGDEGCLSETGYNCDWSPALFASRFMGQYVRERENLFQYCVLMSGGNRFDNPNPDFDVPPEAQRMSTFGAHLDSVKGILAAQLEGLPYVQMGPHDDRVGEKVTGGKSLGDPDWFGAGYDYTANWSVTPQWRAQAGPYEKACALHGNAAASFNAHVSILGKQVDVVDVHGEASASHGTGSFGVDVEFLGKTFEPVSGSAHFHQVESGSLETNRSSATVVVVVVPVTFQAFGELEYGYDIEAEATGKNECGSDSPNPELALRFNVQPFARVNAVASAAVGVSGAQAGVRGRIAMLDAKLPLQAGLAVKPDPDLPSTINLYPTASADFDAMTLSGRMSAFAEVGVWPAEYEAEKTIYSWRGLGDTVPLWQLDSDPVDVTAFYPLGWQQWMEDNQRAAGLAQ